MRFGLILGAAAALVSAATFQTTATADDAPDPKIDVSVAGSTVTATTHDPWHINTDFKWKLKAPDPNAKDAPKPVTGFNLSDHSATLSNAPKGDWVLSGAVCTGKNGRCVPFTRPVSVK